MNFHGPEAERLADAIEAAASRDLYAAMPSGLGGNFHIVAGATVLLLPSIPVSFFNRVIGLGMEKAADEAALDRIVALFAAAGVKNYWIHLSPSARPAGIREWLLARGFQVPPRRTWAKFLRGNEPAPQVATELVVRRAERSEADAVAQIACTGFGMPPTLAPWFASLVGRPGWDAFLALDQGRPVATGALWRQGDTGWVGIGATLPDSRGRGGQSALLAARIAAAGGCRAVETETGEPVNQEPNPSLDNIRRSGFVQVCSRVNYAAPD